MDLVPSDDQNEIVRTLNGLLANELSLAQLRKRLVEESPVDAASYSLVGEMGVFSLGLPEEAGGSGRPVVDEALVFREIGRHLAPVGFVSSVLAARLAASAGLGEHLDSIADGSAPVGLALARGHGDPRPGDEFDAYDLPAATWVVVIAPGSERVLLCAADEFRERREEPCLDPSTHLTVARWSGDDALASSDSAATHTLGSLLVAAMLVGVAETTRDTAVAYAGERIQFGRPIGVNQAVKHPCADAAVRSEAAWSLLCFAAVALRDGRPDAEFQVAAAKRIATEAAIENSRTNVQVHGGMGVTWEHDAHLYLTRSHLLGELFGDVRAQQARILASTPAVP